MKFDENGKIIQFEVGDVFDDPWGDKYEIVTTALRYWNVKGEREYQPWVIFKRLDQPELFKQDFSETFTWTCSAIDLQKDFEDPYEDDEDPQRIHFFEFKYNQIDELNKTFK